MAKPLRQYQKLSRLPLANHIRTAFAQTGRYNPIAIFEEKRGWDWIKSYLSDYLFRRAHPFLSARSAPNQSSVYTVPDNLRLGLAGDWGTGTDEAELVAQQMLRWDDGGATDLTIHLGDVYYVGKPNEIEENCLGGGPAATKAPQDCVTWPHGRLGSFALEGNHEMYAKGYAYFDEFLPRIGMLDDRGKPIGQGPSFFCLENAAWRVIGVDTGYNSVRFPPLEKLFGGNCQLDPAIIDWLRNVVRPQHDNKATVLLSHHQYFSAFRKDLDYRKPAKQLAEFFGKRPVIWFWGHEHRLSGYKLFGFEEFKVHGRCIGHGGMPADRESWDAARPAAKEILFYDARKNDLYPNDDIGRNGFAQLSFEGTRLIVDYKSLSPSLPGTGKKYAPDPEFVLSETFAWNGTDFATTHVPKITAPGFVFSP